MAIFDRLDRIASSAVDRVHAVAFVLSPAERSPNGRSKPSGEQPTIEGRGVFDLVDADNPLELGNRDRRGNDFRTLVGAGQPVLSVDRALLPYEPRQGFRIAVEGHGDFTVTSVRRDGQSRLVLHLAAVGAAP